MTSCLTELQWLMVVCWSLFHDTYCNIHWCHVFSVCLPAGGWSTMHGPRSNPIAYGHWVPVAEGAVDLVMPERGRCSTLPNQLVFSLT